MDSTLPQPPANRRPAPPPAREVQHVRAKQNLIWWLGGISIVFCALFVGIPRILMKTHINSHRTEAINNIHQLGMALFEFDTEYGKFPDASTIPAVQGNYGNAITLHNHSSNQLFRQLIVSGCKSEKPFWAKTAVSPKKSDNSFSTDATMLAPGEVGFAYIPGHSSKSRPDTPLAMAPLEPGKRSFDPEPYQDKAVVLFADSSTRAIPIDKHGRAILNGMDLFDPRQPFWKGKAPDIKWPE
jgi:hypothetical protein